MNKVKQASISSHLIRSLAVFIPAIPISFLYSQMPFCWWKVIGYLMLAYALAFLFSFNFRAMNHKLYCLGVLITLLFIGSVITVIQDFYVIFPPNLGLLRLFGMTMLFLAGALVVFAMVFWLYLKLDIWVCRKLI